MTLTRISRYWFIFWELSQTQSALPTLGPLECDLSPSPAFSCVIIVVEEMTSAWIGFVVDFSWFFILNSSASVSFLVTSTICNKTFILPLQTWNDLVLHNFCTASSKFFCCDTEISWQIPDILEGKYSELVVVFPWYWCFKFASCMF